MNAFVTDGSGVLGASLIRALRWEGHRVTAVMSSPLGTDWLAGDSGVTQIFADDLRALRYVAVLKPEDVVFDTTPGYVAVASERLRARFVTGAMIAPGGGEPSDVGRWIAEGIEAGRVRPALGGTRISDARDIALALVDAATSRISGDFVVAGPYTDFEAIIAQMEYVTGRTIRRSGSPATLPEVGTLKGKPYRLPLRPLHETLADIASWHTSGKASEVMVA